MEKRILINGITLDGAIIEPLLYNIRFWQRKGCRISILGNKILKERINKTGIIDSFNFIEIPYSKNFISKLQFMVEAIKRNIAILQQLDLFRDRFDIVYSRSCVLDLVFFPFFLKKIDQKIQWFAVFDNTVSFWDAGNKIERFLAWLLFRISLSLLKTTNKIFVISDDLGCFLRNQGFRDDRIVTTGNGVENDLINLAKKDPKYNIDALFVGRINEAKGIYDMLEVLKIITRHLPDFQLAILGQGDVPTENAFRKKIQKNKLNNNIKFLGYISGIEKFNIIKSSKVFLFLSRIESFGIALLEAICCGLPAFVYDLKPYKEIYKNNEVFIFKKGGYGSVAKEIINIFERKLFKNIPGELLLNRYSWDKIAEIEYDAFISI